MSLRRTYTKNGIAGHWLSLLFLLFLTAGCGDNGLIEKKRRMVIVLIDYSASNNQQVLERYISIVNETILANLSRYDCLVVVPIDEGSKLKPVKLVYEDLTEKKFARQHDGFAHAQDSIDARFAAYVQEITPRLTKVLKDSKAERMIYTSQTDILGAVQQTSDLIEYNAKTDTKKDVKDFVSGHVRLHSENIIVLLSDMIQDSPEYSFNGNKGVTGKQSRQCMDQLKENSQIPDLSGCKVFCIGATGKNSRQIDNIESFWQDYFGATHADLKAYGFNVEDKLRKYLKEPAS